MTVMNSLLRPRVDPGDRHLLVLAAFAFAIGIFIRFWDLGGAPLAVDEYYLGRSILNIAERGLPQFECGGYYTRGLLLQYMSLPLLQFGASLEFSVRFWPVLASILTIVGVWRIGRTLGGHQVAAIAVILISLSVWEIEFARFGRMYAPFQAVFVWYIYFQIRHLVNGQSGARWWYLGLSAVAIFIFAGASFLLVLNFLALVWRGKKWTVLHLVASSILLIFGVKYYSSDFRYLGVTSDSLPPEAGSDSGLSLPINSPVLPDSPLLLLVAGLLISGLAFWRFRHLIFFRHPATLFWTVAALCLGFGMVGLAAGLVVAGVLLKLPLPTWQNGSGPLPRPASLVALIVVWAALLVGTFLFSGADLPTSLKNSLRYLFDYPDLYYLIVRPWLGAIPVTTIALTLLAAPVFWMVLRSGRSDDSSDTSVLRYLLGALIILLLLAAFFYQPYAITRYTYFLHPLIAIIAAAGIVEITRRFASRSWSRSLVSLAFLAMLAILAEDYSIRHLANINEPEFRYRTAYDGRRSAHYYLRWDFRGAAEYVNSHLRPDDTVIVFDQPLPHYLKRTDGAFVRQGTDIHTLVWACNGTRHLWSNAPLLDRDVEVQEKIDRTKGRVWLVMRTAAVPWLDKLESTLVRQYALTPEFTSQDGHLAVYRIDKFGSAVKPQ